SKALSSAASTYFKKMPSLFFASVAPANAEELNDLSSLPPRSNTSPTLNSAAVAPNESTDAVIAIRDNARKHINRFGVSRGAKGLGTAGIGFRGYMVAWLQSYMGSGVHCNHC